MRRGIIVECLVLAFRGGLVALNSLVGFKMFADVGSAKGSVLCDDDCLEIVILCCVLSGARKNFQLNAVMWHCRRLGFGFPWWLDSFDLACWV
ncbi:hypothetical protein V6N13_000772 [Hibiscus sabdariffa]